jgi:hypothetical protein
MTDESLEHQHPDENHSVSEAARASAQGDAALPAARPSAIALQGGLLSPATHTEAWRIAEVFLNSKAIPKQFQNVAQVFMALQFLRGIGFGGGSDVAALRQCTIINGTLSIWGDLPLAICRRSGKLEWIEEKLYTEDYTEICFANKNIGAVAHFGVCRTQRKGEPSPIERFFSQEDAKRAGLWGKSGPWQTFPNRMMQMRPRSWALKDSYSDALAGISIAEYDHHMLFDGGGNPMRLTEPAKGGAIADEINQEYLGAGEAGTKAVEG